MEIVNFHEVEPAWIRWFLLFLRPHRPAVNDYVAGGGCCYHCSDIFTRKFLYFTNCYMANSNWPKRLCECNLPKYKNYF